MKNGKIWNKVAFMQLFKILKNYLYFPRKVFLKEISEGNSLICKYKFLKIISHSDAKGRSFNKFTEHPSMPGTTVGPRDRKQN